MMQTEFIKPLLIICLLLIIAASLYWYRRKFQSNLINSGHINFKQVASLNLGTRERLVVIEFSNRWLVIGLTPGRMVALAELDIANQDNQNKH